MEDQLGALGLALNCITLWNTFYLDAALTQLRADDYPVLIEDVARLSPYMRRHINVHGHYSFHLPDLAGARRALRDPDAPERGLTRREAGTRLRGCPRTVPDRHASGGAGRLRVTSSYCESSGDGLASRHRSSVVWAAARLSRSSLSLDLNFSTVSSVRGNGSS
jgi:Tn3 transposase DDE domain